MAAAALRTCLLARHLPVYASVLLLRLPPGDYGGDGYEDDGADGFAAGGDLLGGASLLEAAAEAEGGGLRPWAALAGASRGDGAPDWLGGAEDSSGEPSYEELCRCALQRQKVMHALCDTATGCSHDAVLICKLWRHSYAHAAALSCCARTGSSQQGLLRTCRQQQLHN